MSQNRKFHEPADALNRFGDKRRHFARRGVIDQVLSRHRRTPARVRVVITVRSAIRIRRKGVMHAEAVSHVVQKCVRVRDMPDVFPPW